MKHVTTGAQDLTTKPTKTCNNKKNTRRTAKNNKVKECRKPQSSHLCPKHLKNGFMQSTSPTLLTGPCSNNIQHGRTKRQLLSPQMSHIFE